MVTSHDGQVETVGREVWRSTGAMQFDSTDAATFSSDAGGTMAMNLYRSGQITSPECVLDDPSEASQILTVP